MGDFRNERDEDHDRNGDESPKGKPGEHRPTAVQSAGIILTKQEQEQEQEQDSAVEKPSGMKDRPIVADVSPQWQFWLEDNRSAGDGNRDRDTANIQLDDLLQGLFDLDYLPVCHSDETDDTEDDDDEDDNANDSNNAKAKGKAIDTRSGGGGSVDSQDRRQTKDASNVLVVVANREITDHLSKDEQEKQRSNVSVTKGSDSHLTVATNGSTNGDCFDSGRQDPGVVVSTEEPAAPASRSASRSRRISKRVNVKKALLHIVGGAKRRRRGQNQRQHNQDASSLSLSTFHAEQCPGHQRLQDIELLKKEAEKVHLRATVLLERITDLGQQEQQRPQQQQDDPCGDTVETLRKELNAAKDSIGTLEEHLIRLQTVRTEETASDDDRDESVVFGPPASDIDSLQSENDRPEQQKQQQQVADASAAPTTLAITATAGVQPICTVPQIDIVRSSASWNKLQQTSPYLRTDGLPTFVDGPQVLRLDQENLLTVLDGLVDYTHSLLLDKTERFMPVNGTDKVPTTMTNIETENSINHEDGCMPAWSTPVDPNHILIWQGQTEKACYKSDMPVLKARVLLPHSKPSSVLNLLMDNDRVKEYNKMSEGRHDVVVLQENNDDNNDRTTTATTRILRGLNKPPLMRKSIEMMTLVHTRPYRGGYLAVSRSVWESPDCIPQQSNTVMRSEMLMSAAYLRGYHGGGCEMTTLTHAYASAVPEGLARRLAPGQAVNYLKEIQKICLKDMRGGKEQGTRK